MTATSTSVKAAAIAAYKAGLCIMPVRGDGTKAPDVKEWTPYQTERPSRDQMRDWFGDDRRQGLILVCGYDDIEALDFDRHKLFSTFSDTADAAGLGELVERIRNGYEEWTPNGVHLIYRCTKTKSGKLARDAGGETLIETKGKGGYIVISPSHGTVHGSGKPYELKRGGFDSIVTITPAERAALFELAQAFDETEKTEWHRGKPRSTAKSGELRPGDDFNARGPSWREILNGWTFVYRRGQTEYWRRPGKRVGISATINGPGVEPDRLYVFSTNATGFEAGRSYSKFQAMCLIEHNGDFSAAAASLARQGYGDGRDDSATIILNGKRVEPITDTKRTDYPLTDTGNAERLVNRFGDRIRYLVNRENWIIFDGKRWTEDKARQLERMAKAVARDIHDEAADINDEKLKTTVSRFARRSESTAGKRNMIVSAQAEPGVVLNHNDLDAQPHYLNTQSGTVDLGTGIVHPFRKLDYISKITTAPFDSRAECPIWTAFLDRIFDSDDDLIDYIQRAIGYSFTGATDEQVMFIMYGDGANGKSTFLNVLLQIAGPYGRNTPTETLYERRQDAIPNDLAALEGTRLVSAFESDDRRTLSEGRIKQMTGGDRISARFMRAEWFEFTPQFKVWLATNHKPEIKGTDHAIWRRLRLIPFTVRIPVEERDNDLASKLEKEADGILRWVIEGARIWHEQGLQPTPEAVLVATEEYQQESDYVGMWINERCEISPEAQERASILYEDFVDWSRRHGRSPGSQTRFGRELVIRDSLAKFKSGGVILVNGVRIKPPATIRFDGND